MMTSEARVELWRRLAEHTAPECGAPCYRGRQPPPDRCCDALYCEMARQFAREEYGVKFVSTGHPRLPFMGPDGCVVEPHLRPVCTLHVCSINSLGFKPGDEAWTRKYFELREALEAAEPRALDDIVGGSEESELSDDEEN